MTVGLHQEQHAEEVSVTSLSDPLYKLADAAELLEVSPDWLRDQLRQRRFAGVKIASRWRMRESQINAAIEAMSTRAREPARTSPAGLTSRSRIRRRGQQRAAS